MFAGVSDVTRILGSIREGSPHAAEQLLPLVYEELRKLAAARMAWERPGQTLQPTALVHEAWLRLVNADDQTWENRAHFFGAAAESMRRILVDQARRKARLKHGGGQARVALEALEIPDTTPDEKLVLIDEALNLLEQQDAVQARIVVLKFFSGSTNQEVALHLGVTERTVERKWAMAKARLFHIIREELPSQG